MLISRSQMKDYNLSAASSSEADPEGVCCCWCLLSSLDPWSDFLCCFRCCRYGCPGCCRWSSRSSYTRAGAPATSPSSTDTALSGPLAVPWCQRSALPESPIRASSCWCIRVSWGDTWSRRFCFVRDVAFVDPRLQASTDKRIGDKVVFLRKSNKLTFIVRTSCLFAEYLVSESSSHELIESVLIWKLSSEGSSLGEERADGISNGMTWFRGDEALVARIFGGGGRQSASHELLPLFFRLLCIKSFTPALISWERVCQGEEKKRRNVSVNFFCVQLTTHAKSEAQATFTSPLEWVLTFAFCFSRKETQKTS